MGNNAPTLYKCEIHLDNVCGVFLPNDVITGHVFLGADQRVTIDKCLLWCYGRVKTRWEAGRQARSLVTGDDFAWIPPLLKPTKGNNGAAVHPLVATWTSCADGGASARLLNSVASSTNSLTVSTAHAARQRRGKRRRRGASQILFCFRLDLTTRADCAVEPSPPSSAACQERFTALHFRFCLPANLPSSFELPATCLAGGSVASVAYSLRLEIRCSNPTLGHIVRHPFRVLRSLDLADFPTLMDRVTLHREFHPPLRRLFGRSQCLISSEPILCDLSVNKTGFVPGESLMACVNVKNGSNQPIKMVHLSLLQRVKMVGRKESESSVEFIRLFAAVLKNLTVPPSCPLSEEDSMSQTDDTAVPAAGTGYFVETIHVPPLPASQDPQCSSIIQIGYLLLLRLRLTHNTKAKDEFRVHIPITIGTKFAQSTSFLEGTEVSPCYASFDFSTGSIRESNPRDSDYPVYLYFRATAVGKPTSTISLNTSLTTVVDNANILAEATRRSTPHEQPPPLPARRPPVRVAKGLSWEPSVGPHQASSASRSASGAPAFTRYNSESHLRSAATPQLREKLYFDDGELLAQPSSSPSAASSPSSSSSEDCSCGLSPPSSPPCSTLPERPKLTVRVHSAHVECSATTSDDGGGNEVRPRVFPPDTSSRRFRRSTDTALRRSFRRQNSHHSSEST